MFLITDKQQQLNIDKALEFLSQFTPPESAIENTKKAIEFTSDPMLVVKLTLALSWLESIIRSFEQSGVPVPHEMKYFMACCKE